MCIYSVSHKEKTKATLPSGLLPNWRKRNGVVVADDKAQPLPPSVGGLDDYDASANRPKLSINTRDDARINAMVQVLSESDSEDEAIVFKANTKPTRKANTKATPAKTPTTQRSSGRNAATAQTQKSEVKPVILTSDSPDVSSLPAFVRGTWSSVYLPTLYDFLACSDAPWDIFTKNNPNVPIVQEVVDVVYPESGYCVSMHDKIYNMSVDRIYDKRSLIGREAVKLVKAMFERPEYDGKPAATAEYAQYATRADGPAVWRVPTPREFTNPNAPDYVKPIDFLQSEYIIKIFSLIMKTTKGSKGDFGNPMGALALAASAVERAFNMYHTGSETNIGKFSRDNNMQAVDDYIVNIAKFTPRRWKQIIALAGLEPDLPTTTVAPSLHGHRRNLYTPSSPIEPSDDELDFK